MSLRAPSTRQALPKRCYNFLLFNADNKEVFNNLPKLTLTKVRLHIIDNACFYYGLSVILRVY